MRLANNSTVPVVSGKICVQVEIVHEKTLNKIKVKTVDVFVRVHCSLKLKKFTAHITLNVQQTIE